MNEALLISIFIYFLALLLSFSSFYTQKIGLEIGANFTLQGAIVVHALSIGWLLGSVSTLPLFHPTTSLSLVLMLVMIGFLACQASFSLRYVMGFFLFMPLLALGSYTFLMPSMELSEVLSLAPRTGLMGITHGLLSLGALSVLTLSFVSSILYLLMEYRLENKRFDFIFHRLPALNPLELMGYRTTLLGFFFLTLTILSGAVGHHHRGTMFLKLGGQEWIMILIWFIYLLYFQVRYESGMVGGRLAWIAILAYLLQCFAIFFFIGGHPV
ncbi:cytochrome c biogenesis protein CcsA [bacterium]|jgi:HemX protein|nr:cytochrome c biogenesis protein CcsA [bacterium]